MMNDTQWPRYFVFKQDTADERHRYCGSIHASDRHLALMNARDVFVRRPDCYSLWVVPESALHTFQVSELSDEPDSNNKDALKTFHVFAKLIREVQYDHMGDIEAENLDAAEKSIVATFDLDEVAVVWLVDQDSVIRSDDKDQESWFGPASRKPYRQPSFYRTNTMMRAIMRRASEREANGE